MSSVPDSCFGSSAAKSAQAPTKTAAAASWSQMRRTARCYHGGSMVASLQGVAAQVRSLQSQGKRIVFTNGCFDILHSGHVEILRQARASGDVLVVAINSDASVARLKGPNRPIIPERERAELLDGFEMVDFVCTFEEDTPLEAILTIHPDVLIKGADWTDNIVGQREVEGWGGKVVALPLLEGCSTTGIVERVIERYGNTRKTNS